MIYNFSSPAMVQLYKHFKRLYGDEADLCLKRLAMMIGRYGIGFDLSQELTSWNQNDIILISYADMIRQVNEKPLVTFTHFAAKYLNGAFNTIHLLPFFQSSSDDGFSIIHFRTINPALGTWDDIQDLGKHLRLMTDLVLNHVSRQSGWFKDYLVGIAPARDYFIETDPAQDLSSVARPRSSALLTPVNTTSGKRHVWTTFSSDQVDLNYANPDVLFDMLDIFLFYISMGIRIIRLDAIAYLWKKISTSCINLSETHLLVKIFRNVIELVAPDVLLLTETNVPHEENVSYFGTGDEAHMIYQFSLPPLILHALLTGTSQYLTQWAVSLSDPPAGCTFLNFSASHDGIGVRPLEGLMPEEKIQELLQIVRKRGGRISNRETADGKTAPYEMNITYFDALSSQEEHSTKLHIARFLCSQIIPLSLKGIVAVYFNSLVAAGNDYVLASQTGQARSLNRTKWDKDELIKEINAPLSNAGKVFREYSRVLQIRAQQPAFHPDGEQHIFDLGENLFTIERIAPDESERVVAVHNVTDRPVRIPAERLPDIDTKKTSNLLAETSDCISKNTICLAPYESVWLRVNV